MSSAGAAQILEAVMLVCFGFSWPISLIKNIRVRSARAMSLPFICLIITGYVAGIAAKAVIKVPRSVLAQYKTWITTRAKPLLSFPLELP